MSLLSKLLDKYGITTEDDLSPEEKTVFDGYKAILSVEPVSVDSIKEFCTTQIQLIESKFASDLPSDKQDHYYKACLHVYLNILKAIEAPQAEREALERHLTQLITAP